MQIKWVIEWPWGDSTEVFEKLSIGRDPDFSPLAARLNAYPNISRRHAELQRVAQGISVHDLGSVNGTFVAGQRITPDAPVLLEHNTRLRFARDLDVHLKIIREAS
ncbi:MAG: FHA domain-containing protein [Candidatus Contendobacter sp.]|nr:FHA domain-containing protein [Candidatus Contendobacter sp.]